MTRVVRDGADSRRNDFIPCRSSASESLFPSAKRKVLSAYRRVQFSWTHLDVLDHARQTAETRSSETVQAIAHFILLSPAPFPHDLLELLAALGKFPKGSKGDRDQGVEGFFDQRVEVR